MLAFVYFDFFFDICFIGFPFVSVFLRFARLAHTFYDIVFGRTDDKRSYK